MFAAILVWIFAAAALVAFRYRQQAMPARSFVPAAVHPSVPQTTEPPADSSFPVHVQARSSGASPQQDIASTGLRNSDELSPVLCATLRPSPSTAGAIQKLTKRSSRRALLSGGMSSDQAVFPAALPESAKHTPQPGSQLNMAQCVPSLLSFRGCADSETEVRTTTSDSTDIAETTATTSTATCIPIMHASIQSPDTGSHPKPQELPSTASSISSLRLSTSFVELDMETQGQSSGESQYFCK